MNNAQTQWLADNGFTLRTPMPRIQDFVRRIDDGDEVVVRKGDGKIITFVGFYDDEECCFAQRDIQDHDTLRAALSFARCY